MRNHHIKLVLSLCSLVTVVFSVTDSNDFAILKAFREGLENPGLLEWPADGDDPCGQSWKHVFCSGSRVTQIQVQNMSLKGTLPQNLNKLSKLQRLGLQRNQFTGALPSLGGLSELQYVYLDFNQFDSIPSNCFDGLVSLQFLALDSNNFNASTGWSFPEGLQGSAQLTNLSCMFCNLAGPLPVFLGSLPSLRSLKLSGNNLSGEIPVSFKGGMSLQNLWLNDQNGGGLSGTIDVVTTMDSVNVLWLHGNQFTGTIPESIGNLTVLQDLNLNSNQLVGFVPDSLAKMPLQHLDLNNNQLMGPIPKFKATEVSCSSNAFCQSTPGVPCAPEVMALLEFLGSLNYPSRLVSSWTGNNPCLWLGLACDPNSKVNSIVLPNHNLSGTLSPSVAKLGSLFQVKLASNNLGGHIPDNWTSLTSLKTLDLSANNISPPLPKFSGTVNVVISGNPLFNDGSLANPIPSPGNNPSSGGSDSPTSKPSSPNKGISSSPMNSSVSTKPKMSTLVAIIAPVASIAFIAILVIPLSIYCCKKRKDTFQAPSSLVIHPRDPSDSDNTVKDVVAHYTNGSASKITGNGSASRTSSGIGESRVIEAGNLVISVQVLRNVTKNFASENELGRGGFGVVYKGELDDGTKIAVKRMEALVISSKGLDEFQAEIAVLSKVRHRHLVSLLGYSIEGCERILVYEYMPQGALSRHLFHWKSLKLEPLSWKRRLNIALDVARGMEYLHSLAHQCFIHRDLKSSNILLGDDFRAKVSDFGLVKLAPDGEESVVTRLAGTFGYLAPEYAAAASTFTRFFPRIKARYDYGFVIFILTFSLVSVSGYRVEKLLVLTHQRLSTVLIGGATCILLSFIFPVWAGEDLHKLVASNVEKLAKYQEGFEGEFFQPLEDGRNVKVSNSDKSFLQGYKKVLNSKSTEESVANLARWEPGHGRFGFRHPWKQYLKIGALSRQCAYQIEALDAYINSHNQVIYHGMAPLNFRCKIQGPCTRMFIECSMALESLASAIKTMTLPSSANVHVENSKTAIKDLKIAIKTVSLDQDQDLLAIVPAATVASIIIEIVKCVENLSESVHELSNLAHFKSVESTVSLEKPQFLHRGSIKPVLEGDADRVIIAIDGKSADSPESENTQGPMPGQRLEV